jgi:hypothetical protein
MEFALLDEPITRRMLRRVTRRASHQAAAVARFLSFRWGGARGREIRARTPPAVGLARLGDAHRRLLAAPPETEILTQDPRALSGALALLIPFPVAAADLQSAALRLVGGRPLAVHGVTLGALHYEWEGLRVSLFQMRARTLSPPALRRVLARSDSFLLERIGGLTLVAWSFGRTSCVLVAESVPAHLLVLFARHAREKLKSTWALACPP